MLALGLHRGTFAHALEYEPYEPQFDGLPSPRRHGSRAKSFGWRVRSATAAERKGLDPGSNRAVLGARLHPTVLRPCSSYGQSSFGVVFVLHLSAFFPIDPGESSEPR